MPETDHRRHRHKVKWVLLAAVLLAVLAAGGLHLRQRRRLRAERDRLARAAQAGPKVVVAQAEVAPGARTVTLPGDLRAFRQVQLTARVSGYLRKLNVEVGDRVAEGQTLGVLESPQAQEAVRAAQADVAEKRRTAARARALAPPGVISKQELDQANAALAASEAALEAAKANLAYATLEAPFAGVVTGRFADPGALLQPGTPLLELRDPTRLRVIVFAGQEVAGLIREGDPAEVALGEGPGAPLQAKVSRTAEALDPRSRTMQVEVWLDNRDGRLVPGSFAHVTLQVNTPPLPTVPSEALLTRGEQTLVAVVREGRVHLVPVTPGLDDGKTVQLRAGLQGGEQVALSLPPELGEGSPVQAVPRPRPAAEPGPRSGRAPPGR